MLVPVTWMEEYVPGGTGKADVAERMALSGSNVEMVKEIGDGSVSGVVLGRITKVWPHPDSDHLLLCLVDAGAAGQTTANGGDETAGQATLIQIVTGAPNVKEGDYVPVALHGAELPGGLKIKRGKLRGEASEGMVCSAQELGFDDKVVPLSCKDGIWVLPEEMRQDSLVGMDIFEALGLANEKVIEFEITPNRPDCLAVYGLAAEYAAVYDLPLAPAEKVVFSDHPAGAEEQASPRDDAEGHIDGKEGKHAEDHIKVSIAKPGHCSRYVARVAEDVVIRESPWWLQKRLMLAGMRPINNIVDITNFVMLELGHPIHAFDIREIAGGEINVDTAEAGEKFTTLDGTEHTLYEDTLLIKDGARGVAIAGVMGGLNSEITDDTKTILIEAAAFSPDSVRRTSKKLGIRTEASSRFEKGVPAGLSRAAADRVCQLITLTGAGTVLPGAADCYPIPQEQKDIFVRTARMNQVLGTGLSAEEMAGILRRLGIGVKITAEGDLGVMPPITRLDLREEIDISEEIARIHGYDRLESTIHADGAEAGVSLSWALRDVLRDLLTGLGLSEIQTYSFVSPAGVSLMGYEEDKEKTAFVRLINPLGEENSVMRTTLLPGLVEALSRNYNHSIADCRLFEVGNTFVDHINEEGLPAEGLSLCAGVYGGGADFFFLKGCAEKIFQKFGIGAPVFEPAPDIPAFHPGRCARVLGGAEGPGRVTAEGKGRPSGNGDAAAAAESVLYGVIGELHPDVLGRFGIGERVCCLEFDFDLLVKAADLDRAYKPLPKYPAVLRDIALLADDDVPVGELLRIIRQRGGRILEAVDLFDVYRGRQVPEGKKSLAFGLVFRDRERTLTDEDAGKAMKKILKGLEDEAGAVLRDT